MNIPNKIYCKVEQLPFMHRAIVLALITEYMETGTINPEAQGAPLEFFMGVKAELDGVLKKEPMRGNTANAGKPGRRLPRLKKNLPHGWPRRKPTLKSRKPQMNRSNRKEFSETTVI